MKIEEYYLKIRIHYEAFSENSTFQGKISDISNVLFCSEKHTKRLLRKFEENNWLSWQRGQGRGNVSVFVCQEDCLQWLEQYINKLQLQKDFSQIMSIIELPFPQMYRDRLVTYIVPSLGIESNDEKGDVLRVMMQRNLSTLDPALVSITAESHLASEIFDRLVEYKKETATIEPSLAHHWEWDEEKMCWIFYLRKHVKFHNGKILTSEDVKFSIERLQTSLTSRWIWRYLVSIQCDGPYKVIFYFRQNMPWFLHFLSTVNASILSKSVSFNEKEIIGSGPFSVESYDKYALKLKAHDVYFKERALVDWIELYFVEKPLPDERFMSVSDSQGDFVQSFELIEDGCMYGMFQIREGSILNDKLVRKALYHCLNGEALINDIENEKRVCSSSSFLPAISLQEREQKSFAIAKQALEESSYQNEEIIVYHWDFDRSTEDGIWFKERCEEIGLRITLRPRSIHDYYNEELAVDGDMVLMGEVFGEDEFLAFISLFYNETCFIRRYMNEAQLKVILPMVEAYALAENIADRRDIQRKIETYMKENYWISFNYHVQKRTNYSSFISGIQLTTFAWPHFRELWLKR